MVTEATGFPSSARREVLEVKIEDQILPSPPTGEAEQNTVLLQSLEVGGFYAYFKHGVPFIRLDTGLLLVTIASKITTPL